MSNEGYGNGVTRRGFIQGAGALAASMLVSPVVEGVSLFGSDPAEKKDSRILYGFTAWSLVPGITEENAAGFFKQASELDIPGKRKSLEVFASADPKDLPFAGTISDMADDAGFDVVACGFNGAPANGYEGPKRPRFLCSADSAERQASVDTIGHFIRYGARVCRKNRESKKVVSGPFEKAHKNFTGQPITEREEDHLIEGFQKIDKIAEDNGVEMALEPLNRFESYVICTVGDAVKLIVKAGTKYIGINWDSSHAGLQEKDMIASLDLALREGLLKHLHFCENDREEYGKAQIARQYTTQIIETLDEAGYQGAANLELFCPELYPIVGIPNEFPAKGEYAVLRDSFAHLNSHVNLYNKGKASH